MAIYPKIPSIISLVLANFFFLSPVSRGDWITRGQFSAKAGIDSIQRFLVIPDIDTVRVFGKFILPLGDINGDHMNEILIHRQIGSVAFVNPTFLFYGGYPPDANNDGVFNNFQYALKVIGDVNNDGYIDLAQTAFPKLDFALYFGWPTFDDTADFVIPNMWSWITKAVDLNDDGELEIPLSKNVNGGPVKIYPIGPSRDTNPEYVINDTSRSFGNNLVTGDFNGDGYSDLAVAAFLNRDSCFVKFFWGGPNFDTIPDYIIYNQSDRFGEILFSLGDFNEDGYDDLFIAGEGDYPYGIHFGGPSLSGTPNLIVNQWLYGGHVPLNSADVAGDINNDGYPDLIIGYADDVNFVNYIKIFLGGPDADSIADVYLENLQIPGGQDYFGDVVAGIGDFNGDGIDDFAVRSQTTSGCCWRGEVNLFAGWNSQGTSTPEDKGDVLPKEFDIQEIYPNPFNGETIIEFSTDSWSEITLEVYDLLGREVRKLTEGKFSSGKNKISWDGKDYKGQAVSSGVYFVRLFSNNHASAKKIMLLK